MGTAGYGATLAVAPHTGSMANEGCSRHRQPTWLPGTGSRKYQRLFVYKLTLTTEKWFSSTSKHSNHMSTDLCQGWQGRTLLQIQQSLSTPLRICKISNESLCNLGPKINILDANEASESGPGEFNVNNYCWNQDVRIGWSGHHQN